ncbi:unnamed protein product [Paramecium primaurelia]|uniref:Uncharacterized protein n=1 Tax=Paramecium primaurelia TaxID=5886 RepID=A0A8S1LNE4_PARPR|nr:unnamed protein product [Paramecium primaurelia]CAD8068319.1 unnamed protein product [Paramecium primaurelia]
MSYALEDLGRVFPKKSVLLKTYMLGCFYLFYQTIKPEEQKKEKKRIAELRPNILRNQSQQCQQYQRNLYQMNVIKDQKKQLKEQQNTSYGLMEFRTSIFSAQDLKQLNNSTSQVHVLQIHSKKYQIFCLDDLSTIESEFIPDLKFDLQTRSPVDMTQSCIF